MSHYISVIALEPAEVLRACTDYRQASVFRSPASSTFNPIFTWQAATTDYDDHQTAAKVQEKQRINLIRADRVDGLAICGTH